MAGPLAQVGSGGGVGGCHLGVSVEAPTDMATWEWCAIILLFMSPPGCPVGLSFRPLQRQLVGVALAVGGRSLEEPKDLE